MELIRNFKNLDQNDVAIAGGKGASLGEMTQAGITVPPGFVILVGAFEKFLAETDLNVEIDSILHTVDHKEMHTVENAAEKIQSLILGAELPKDIAVEAQKYFKNFNAKFVAVRSSATAEDSSLAAWAGQLESYLNTTEDNLLENFKKCWASLFSSRAIFYRFEKGLHNQKISVAVVVQKMVNSEVSGIAFSVHPVTQDKNQMIIEAGLGLGEAIVSGQITPDSYVVEKGPVRIIDKNINKQEKAMVRSTAGGNEWVNLSKSKQEGQKLSDGEILELSKLIIKIEKHYGFPVDIEWAKENGKFYITQARPITTLQNLESQKQTVLDYIKSQSWWFGVRADESLLFYSAKRGEGYGKYIKKEYGVEFTESLLAFLDRDYPIRVFNLAQTKIFHAISDKKIFKNPKIILSYIKKNNLSWKNIARLCKNLLAEVKKKNYPNSIELFQKIFDLYETVSGQGMIIFSLGLKLTQNKDNIKNIKGILKKHDTWRNSIAFTEEEMGKSLFYFFRALIKQRNADMDPALLMKFLTLDEISAWLDGDISNEEAIKKVNLRKKQGFIYLDLRNKKLEVIDSLGDIKAIRKYLLGLIKISAKNKNTKEVKGDVAYKVDKRIRGRVVVVMDKRDLENKSGLLKNKILVAIQTTPHYIPYIREVKAIVTDEGGLTCHAAIIAREFKKPCVMGTKTATRVLKDGDLVEVDTEKGVVKIIKR